MRYLSWDVLLFGQGSSVPIQEFRTGCFVTKDPETLQIQASLNTGSLYRIDRAAPASMPTVATFIPLLPAGQPFNVSIHAWEKPQPSQPMATLAQQKNRDVVFEARVFVDGQCVGGNIVGDKGLFPVVIDRSFMFDKDGNIDNLRFPPFHEEMLTQGMWQAGENMGRIKVLIAEGLFTEQPSDGKQPFERVRNVVAFSFQHAPLEILENSGIAWPNPAMWHESSQPMYRVSLASFRKPQLAAPGSHAHLQRQGTATSTVAPVIDLTNAPSATAKRGPSMHTMPPPTFFGKVSTTDPFVDRENEQHSTRRAGSEDVPMPDYSHSITPASSRNITGSNHGKGKATEPAADEHYATLVKAMSARKDGTSGTFAPANTRNSSTVSVAPPAQTATKPSAAAEARAASYSGRRARIASAKDRTASTNRLSSDVSMKSRFSEAATETQDVAAAETKALANPAESVKGKKEGKAGEAAGKQRETSATTATTDAKRKRTPPAAVAGAAADAVTPKAANENRSPTRKVSRKDGNVGQDAEVKDADSSAKGPLQVVENV